MTKTIGIYIFDGAEELDFVGPFEVFTMCDEVANYTATKLERTKVVLISENGGTVTGAKGMRVMADASFETAPPLDVFLIPGGNGTRALVNNQRALDWIAEATKPCEWITSVCTGSLVLGAAGPAKGKRVTTHWTFIEGLRERGDVAEVLENIRYVRDGNVVTSAGVSAGIDMALWLVGQMFGADHARLTQKGMEYDPAPPYAAEV